jgi:GT2 family glycosyltransferase
VGAHASGFNRRSVGARNETKGDGGRDGRISVVVVTRNRRDSLLRTLARLGALPERPRVVVVDNASTDGSPGAARDAGAEVIALERNAGPFARTLGARAVATPYVAFSDDDSWWAPGALSRAADALDGYERLALVAGHVVIGPEERDDPTVEAMRKSPLPADGALPGPPVLGFVACGAVVRRAAFLEVGGFPDGLGTGAEETLLAVDLASRGWQLAYLDDVVAHHHPSSRRDLGERRRAETRNVLWVAWLRRPPGVVATETASAVRAALRDADARRGLLDVARRLPRLVRERRPSPPEVEAKLRTLGL